MKACVLHAVGDLRYEEVDMPILASHEVLVRVRAVGVCGSDIPRIFTHGTYRFPLIPGHEFAGEIAGWGTGGGLGTGREAPVEGSRDSSGEGLRKGLRIGDRVVIVPLVPCRKCIFCQVGEYGECDEYDYLGSRRNGGFAEYVAVPAANLIPIPEGVTFEEAAMTEPAAVSLHAARRGGISAGDTVAILGSGPIGLLTAEWAQVLGAAQVVLADIDEQKLQLAKKFGFDHTINAGGSDPVKAVLDLTEGRGADVVIEAAGVPATVEQSILMARKMGRIVLMGNPSSGVALDQNVFWQILRKQLGIFGTWNSTFAELPCNEWKSVLLMVQKARLRLAPMITHKVPLKKAAEVLKMMRDRTEFFCKVMIVM